MKNSALSPCSFCRFWTGYSCMVSPSPTNCKQAKSEYYQYNANKNIYAAPKKSLRKWDKK